MANHPFSPAGYVDDTRLSVELRTAARAVCERRVATENERARVEYGARFPDMRPCSGARCRACVSAAEQPTAQAGRLVA